MEMLKEFWYSFDAAVRKGLCIALSIIMLFGSGYFIGAVTNMSKTADAPVVTTTTAAVNTVATMAPATTTAAPEVTTTAAQAPSTTVPAPVETTAAEATTAAQAPSGTMSTEEIVALFNESAGKIKTTATKATRNYQDMRINKMELPSALQAIADAAIEKYVKPDMTPQEYVGTEAIKEKYPVSGTDFASKLKVEYLESITCTDTGAEYVIDIVMKDQMNPVYRSGEGVGSIFWTMNIDDIANNVPGLQKAELSYYDCTATAKIDKATGNMTYTKFDYNFDMLLEVKMLATLNANASMTVVEEYVIEY